MSSLDKFTKNIKYKQNKHNRNSIKRVTLFAGLGIAIGGTVLGLLYQRCCSEITHIIIKNAKDFDEDINEDINIKKDEIKQTLKNKANEPMGDVGSAMEEALEDLEVEEQDENDVIE
ncbi:MAG: hypothetical protein MUO60_04545 [Clostridiaceae bacterium]|nr:hypothetical protein [Clostridiaceae bacterium]